MKKQQLLFLMLGLLFSNLIYAQRENFRNRQRLSVEERAKIQTTLMTDSLGLNEDQVVLVDEINLKYAKEREGLITNGDLTREERMFDLETQEIKREKELKKILDKDQFKKMKELEEQRRAKMRERMRERRGRGPGAGGIPPNGPPDGEGNY